MTNPELDLGLNHLEEARRLLADAQAQGEWNGDDLRSELSVLRDATTDLIVYEKTEEGVQTVDLSHEMRMLITILGAELEIPALAKHKDVDRSRYYRALALVEREPGTMAEGLREAKLLYDSLASSVEAFEGKDLSKEQGLARAIGHLDRILIPISRYWIHLYEEALTGGLQAILDAHRNRFYEAYNRACFVLQVDLPTGMIAGAGLASARSMPSSYEDELPDGTGFRIYNGLLQIGPDRKSIQPELDLSGPYYLANPERARWRREAVREEVEHQLAAIQRHLEARFCGMTMGISNRRMEVWRCGEVFYLVRTTLPAEEMFNPDEESLINLDEQIIYVENDGTVHLGGGSPKNTYILVIREGRPMVRMALWMPHYRTCRDQPPFLSLNLAKDQLEICKQKCQVGVDGIHIPTIRGVMDFLRELLRKRCPNYEEWDFYSIGERVDIGDGRLEEIGDRIYLRKRIPFDPSGADFDTKTSDGGNDDVVQAA